MVMLRDAWDDVAIPSRLGGLELCAKTTSPPAFWAQAGEARDVAAPSATARAMRRKSTERWQILTAILLAPEKWPALSLFVAPTEGGLWRRSYNRIRKIQ